MCRHLLTSRSQLSNAGECWFQSETDLQFSPVCVYCTVLRAYSLLAHGLGYLMRIQVCPRSAIYCVSDNSVK